METLKTLMMLYFGIVLVYRSILQCGVVTISGCYAPVDVCRGEAGTAMLLG